MRTTTLFRLDPSSENVERSWQLKFWRRPIRINGSSVVESVDFEQTEPVPNGDFADENLPVQNTRTIDTIPCGLLIKSIGYQGIQIDPWLPFDADRGIIRSRQSRVDDRPGLYCTGWIGRGARGVIAETTTEGTNASPTSFHQCIVSCLAAHTVARRIMDDIEHGPLTHLDEPKAGGDGLISLATSRHVRCVTYDDWKKLDAHETQLGSSRGKPREKIVDIRTMLDLTSSSKT